ncbi:4-alpha-glucanotransferase [Vibrio sp. JC009]|uniref:4-alpha-glucanotransferase n=1 Tax=Vibrio sp. JC009 TaxID=2912314 RepID=UPI0023B032B1|nr:4-alpha-glucanotransferase [Vibrio sp. JC009]WED23990.1 4-alpha-glucanotransferase [Vibrio sp. JC009]
MTEPSVLKQVAEMARISDNYISAWGDPAYVEDATIRYLLGSLGYDTSSDEKLLKSAQEKHRKTVLEPTLVVKDSGLAVEVALNLDATALPAEFNWRLVTEQGEKSEGAVSDLIVRDERSEGGPLVFALPALEWGYHKLEVSDKKRTYATALIVAPQSCYKQESMNKGKKHWGPSVQLYTLRTADNWGIGDFSDLKQLVSETASRGADFVGLNPIHALFPANPEGASPYSPSSRSWLNILYIDVNSVEELSQCADAQKIVESAEFQQRLKAVRKDDWVNYTEVAALKMAVLPLLFNEFKVRHLDKQTQRGAEFLSFIQAGGESLKHQAVFDALHEKLYQEDSSVWGWPVFPEKYRKYESAAVKEFIRENEQFIQSYMYFQWIADCQLNEAQKLAEDAGMSIGLYRDLAVGVTGSGSESWVDDGNLILDASVGAPPDIFGPLGQNWGLPPLNPQVLQATGYDAFVKLIRANMKHCGALRIDHVLGLLRLWWIPQDKGAKDGAYIYYPVDDMLAILALESHRHQCSVIGEDLGTVPDEIVDILANAGIHSYKLFFQEIAEDGGFYSPAHYTEQSMAALCTHDMPTLRGFWHCDDLKRGRELGLYRDEEKLKVLFDNRLDYKQEILKSLASHGYLPEGVGLDASLVPMDSYLSDALHLHLAAGSSSLLSIQLEDWLEMDMPVNIPGTVDEYPNWRRKLSVTLDEVFARDQVNRIAEEMTRVRAKASNQNAS